MAKPFSPGGKAFSRTLTRYYGIYTGGFIFFVVLLAIAELMGLPNEIIGYFFIAATVGLYAGIGILTRTADIVEYYVAGRRVPAIFNGMATGSDWMSAASFIGMAGTLYLSGYDGLAFVMGWSGGYVLVALLLAPYLRKFGQFTVPDFLGARYGGNLARSVGVVAVILASFIYVVAQIYGVGLIAGRILGLEFDVGVFVGLAGILVCSFLGGMRAVTWTQVAQYIILIIAYLVPVIMLSQRIAEVPVPQVIYGQVLEKLSEREKIIFNDPQQVAARDLFKQREITIREKIHQLEGTADNPAQLEKLRKEHDAAKAGATPPTPHVQPFPGADPQAERDSLLNFLALTFCLMLGTAALPHVLIRYYTTPSVREARTSVFWSLFFISLLYFTAPALAVLVKFEVYSNLIGSSIADLPSWVAAWGKVGLVSIDDINHDGILQLAELTLNPDVIVLATPEIAGLPYVVSGLVAAGGLAAALSTADGLLLTIANALSHDVYFKMIDNSASTRRRVFISKFLLLFVAVVAAYVASRKPDHILFMVAWAFSIAASAFFPALVLGVFWRRANQYGAVTGMLTGLGVCLFYLIGVKFYAMPPWFGIKDIAAGVFGVPAGFVSIIAISLLTPAPDKQTRELVEHCRYPHITPSRRQNTENVREEG